MSYCPITTRCHYFPGEAVCCRQFYNHCFCGILTASLKHMQMNYISLAATEMEKMARCQEPNQKGVFVTSPNTSKETYKLSILVFFCVWKHALQSYLCISHIVSPWLFLLGINKAGTKSSLSDKCHICGLHVYCFAMFLIGTDSLPFSTVMNDIMLIF